MREYLPRLLEGRRHLPDVNLRRGSIGEVHNTGECLHVVQLRARRPLSQESLEKIVEITLGDIIENPLVNALKGSAQLAVGARRLKLCLTSMPIPLLCTRSTILTAVSSTLPGGERCPSSTSPARWRARDETFTPLIFIEEGTVDSRTMKVPGSRIVEVT
jgi:hypothetical protein